MYRNQAVIRFIQPLVVLAMVLTLLLANIQPALAAGTIIDTAAGSGTQVEAFNSNETGDGGNLLQFTTAGHVLGFSGDGVILASASHMLKIEFLNARMVAPEADESSSGEAGDGAAPLSRVTYDNIWDGVTVVYEASEGSILKSTYYISATESGVPVNRIRLGYNRPVSIDGDGNLVVAYENGTMVESAPIAWQEIAGERKPVAAAYALYGDREVGFSLGDYVPGIPVVIDPSATWNTFLGGSGNDGGVAIAVDGRGNVYVCGASSHTWGSPVRAHSGGLDVFVAKLDSDGNLVWNTFLGGSGNDGGFAIAVDGSGNVYVSGNSYATWGDGPVRAYTEQYDAFAAKLDGSGTLTWNTFLGGSGNDGGSDIAVDGSGNVYVGGYSYATWGSPVLAYTGGFDAFAAKLNGSDGSLSWNTFLGSSVNDYGRAIAVDGSGNVYVSGESHTTWGSPVRAYTSGDDVFAAKLNGDGNLSWNTFLGGSGEDCSRAIAMDGSGNVYVSGESHTTWGSPVRAYTSGDDAFAAKLGSDGSLSWNTFLGGSGNDYGYGVAVGVSGNVYVSGESHTTWGSPVREYAGGLDAFAAKLGSDGSLSWNTFLGGSGNDYGYGVAVGGSGNVYVCGYSDSTWGSPMRAYTSGDDAFAAKLNSDGSLGIAISGTTREVNCDILAGATVELFDGATLCYNTTNDGSGNYTVYAPSSGTYTVKASKDGFGEETLQVVVGTDPVTADFCGDHGLIPNAPGTPYLVSCIHYWLHPELGCELGTPKLVSVIHAWLHPVT